MDTNRIGANRLTPQQMDRLQGVDKELHEAAEKPLANKEDSSVQVHVSAHAKELLRAKEKAETIAKNTPDVREELVAKFKEKIESGQYKPDAGNIADGLLREAIKEHLSKVDQK